MIKTGNLMAGAFAAQRLIGSIDAFRKGAIRHTGIAELREKPAKRGRPAKAPEERRQQIALRVGKDVLDGYRAQGIGWQTRMNAVLKAFRDAST
jgi:uncharacterized protein (DUF4415 family)